MLSIDLSYVHTSSRGLEIPLVAAERGTPIHRLPSELLQSIFTYYLDDQLRNPKSDRRLPLQPHGAPWALATICHRWRETVLSNGQFWGRLTYHFLERRSESVKKTTEAAMPRTLEMTSLQLSRSHNSSLSIYIVCKDFTSSLPPLLQLLAHHRHRWRALTVVDSWFRKESCADLRDVLFSPIECPLLERLLVTLPSFSTGALPMFTSEIFPSLKRLHLTVPDSNPQLPPLRWTQMQDFSISYMPHIDRFLADNHQQFTNLTALTITCAIRGAENHGAFMLPSLRSIHCIGMESLAFIYTLITAPLLESVIANNLDSNDVAALSACIHRSQCSIQSLQCGIQISADAEILLPLLEEIKTAQHLLVCCKEMQFIPFTEPLHWMEGGKSFKYCPQLRRLSLYGDYAQDNFGFLDMLKKRSTAGLQTIEFFYDTLSQTSGAFADHISVLKDEGLDVRFEPRIDMDRILQLSHHYMPSRP